MKHTISTDIGTIILQRSGPNDVELTIDNSINDDYRVETVIISQNIAMALACLIHSLVNDDEELG